jgi:L-lactate dehydrogenase complex protein LldG
MTTRANSVIESVRRALGRAAGDVLGPRPTVLPPRDAGGQEAEIDLLLKEIGALSGLARRISAAEIDGTLAQVVEAERIRRATLWSTPRLRELEMEARLQRLGVEIVPASADKRALAECDLGVTEADFALPETGTLGLLSSPEKPRAVSLLPRVHLAIVSREAVRTDLHQVFAEAKKHPYLIFITGPSRTADIELTVTLGVHGPQALHVWVV